MQNKTVCSECTLCSTNRTLIEDLKKENKELLNKIKTNKKIHICASCEDGLIY